MEENLKELLNLVKEVCEKNRQYKKGFNVITTFVKPHREVELHSRFITWLLDPKNDSHGLETLPLELFLKHLNSQFKVSKEKNKTVVVPNASNWTEDRDMDILIKGLVNEKEEESAIIIENKIYAKDSDKGENNGQLARYLLQVETGGVAKNNKLEEEKTHFFCPKQNIELYYLTLDGHEPEEKNFTTQDGQSATIEDKYKKIKYLDHIEPWLKSVLNKDSCKSNPQTTDLILQYLDALHCVSPDVKLNHDLFASIEQNESYVEALKNLLENHPKLINLQPEKIEDALSKEVDESLMESAVFLLKNHRHLYWHALNDFFIKLQDELHSIFGDNLLPREIDKNTNKEKTIDRYVSEIIFEEKDASKLAPMYYRIRKANEKEWTLQPNRAKGFFLGLDKKQINGSDGWETEIYLSEFKDEKEQIPLLNLWDFTKGDTFDLLNEKRRQEIAHQYAKFVKDELAKLN